MKTEDLIFGGLLLGYAIGLWNIWRGQRHSPLAEQIKTLALFLAVLILPVLGWLLGWKP